MTKKKEEPNTQIAKRDMTHSQRFLLKVQKEFSGAVGHGVEFSSFEKQLASNLFLKTDSALKEFEAKRLQRGDASKRTPFTWENVNMEKLSVDAVHRVRLGLDALIPNHLHAIAYFNSKSGKYDLDLRIGYRGKHHIRMKMATEDVKDIRYELVHENDVFEPLPRDSERPVESYKFAISNPFDRGNVIGGFGYIIYDDETKNRLVMVSEEEFEKVRKIAQTQDFWGKWGDKMRYKTLVHRVTDHLDLDPAKINPSYHYVESQDSMFVDEPQEQPENRQLVDFEATTEPENPEKPEDEEIKKAEKEQELPFNQ